MGVKDLITNEQYKEALNDIKYSFMFKVFLKTLLVNDSDERPDFILAKKIFDKIFMTQPENAAELNEILESAVDLDTCGVDIILSTVNNYLNFQDKNISEAKSCTFQGYDTPFTSDILTQKSKCFKNIWNSNSKGNNENDSEAFKPLKLDLKFSNCLEIDEGMGGKSEVTEFLEKTTESNSRILPISKIVKQQNPFTNKIIICKIHNKPATTAWLLVHYGEYFWDLCHHSCGEVEDISQNSKIQKSALKEIHNVHSDLINRIESLNKRRLNTEDIDLIFYQVFDSIKEIHLNQKQQRALSKNEEESLLNFILKVKTGWTELKMMKKELDSLYKKGCYYGIYQRTQEYQIKLAEIGEIKQEVKWYLEIIERERKVLGRGKEEIAEGVVDWIQNYFYKCGKIV